MVTVGGAQIGANIHMISMITTGTVTSLGTDSRREDSCRPGTYLSEINDDGKLLMIDVVS